MRCDTCKFFVISRGSTQTAYGECRRYPKPRARNRDYWCGEYIIKPE